MRQGSFCSAHGGFLSSIVTIETENRCFHHFPDAFDLIFGERGTEWSHNIFKTGLSQSNGVHIAFDHQYPAGLTGCGRSLVEIVEGAPFVE